MNDHLDRLEKLTNLYERGALNASEFEEQKARLLNQGGATETSSSTTKRSFVLGWVGWALTITGMVALSLLIMLTWRSGLLAGADGETVERRDLGRELDGNPSAEQIIAFDDLINCEPSDEFATLLEDIEQSGSEEQPNALIALSRFKGSPLALTATAVRDGKQVRVSAADLTANWHGLRLRRIAVVRWSDEIGDGFSLLFADTPKRVTSVLRKQGWPAAEPGQLKKQEKAFSAITANPIGAAVSCYPREVKSSSVG